MKNKIKYNSYEGMGFIESLIAIMVVGVASVVLMRIAASTMSDAVENERIDKMTQYAVEGANMAENIVQEFYEYPTSSDAISFFDKIAPSFPTNIKCFIPDTTNSGVFEFKKDDDFKILPIYSLTIETINIHREDFEDAILDERGRALAFEGKRWFDLVRVAERRNSPEYLADKVAAKFAGTDMYNTIHSKLMNPANWYLPSN